MKKSLYLTSLMIVALVAFSTGYLMKQPQEYHSCKSAYDNLVRTELCEGKIEEHWGTEAVIGNIEYFDFNWDENIGSYGAVRSYVGGINKRCYYQAERQFIQNGRRENLINCFANEIQIEDGVLEIRCGCFFG